MKERLQKVLALAGVASRRKAEELVRAGRVRVDGRVVSELGARADPHLERVEVDGRRVAPEPLVYLALHKPRGVMCTLHDPEGRPTIREHLRDVPVRVVPIGRLDFHTSGILLLTNDGDFAAALSHPRTGAPKEYIAKVRGIVDDVKLERWRQSIVIDGRATQPAEVRRLRTEDDKTWLAVVLHEGRNRQVRRLGDEVGFPVLRLVRASFAGISHENLRPGEWRQLTVDELRALKKAYGVPRRVRPPTDLEWLARARAQGASPRAAVPARAEPARPRQRARTRSEVGATRAPGSRGGRPAAETRKQPGYGESSARTAPPRRRGHARRGSRA